MRSLQEVKPVGRFHVKRSHSKLWSALPIYIVAVSIGLIGCPAPRWYPVRYHQDEFGKKKEYYDVWLADGKSKLRFTGRTGGGTDPVIRVFVEARYAKGAAKDFRYVPSKLKMLIENKEIEGQFFSDTYIPDSTVEKDYVIPNRGYQSFDFVTTDNILWQYYRDGIKRVEYQLIVDSFVIYKGEAQKIRKPIWGLIH